MFQDINSIMAGLIVAIGMSALIWFFITVIINIICHNSVKKRGPIVLDRYTEDDDWYTKNGLDHNDDTMDEE